MNSEPPEEVINQHYTDAAPDRTPEELVRASQLLVDHYGSASKAAEETKASSHSLLLWNRLNDLPDDILGYVYMEKISPTTADIIRRLESERAQRLVSIVIIEEDLPQKYVELLEEEISEKDTPPEEAIESVIGEMTTLRSITLGLDKELHTQLWAEAGRRQCSNVAELCETLIYERIEQITEIEPNINSSAKTIQKESQDLEEQLSEFSERLDDFNESIAELRDQIEHE